MNSFTFSTVTLGVDIREYPEIGKSIFEIRSLFKKDKRFLIVIHAQYTAGKPRTCLNHSIEVDVYKQGAVK